jgi:hypothetical protein
VSVIVPTCGWRNVLGSLRRRRMSYRCQSPANSGLCVVSSSTSSARPGVWGLAAATARRFAAVVAAICGQSANRSRAAGCRKVYRAVLRRGGGQSASGAIVNISSAGARSCPVGTGHYAASKAALEALTASLRIQPLGITVMTVEPGAFRTSYKRSLTQARDAISDYAGTVGARRTQDPAEDGRQPGDPARAAQAIITAVHSPDTPLMLVLGPDALTWLRDAVKELNADVDTWEQTSLSTSFPG